MKALLVDPDSQRAPALAQALRAGGADVAIAPSASFALTMLEWNKQDVIISRARLGDMEGHELCAIVRSDPSTKDVRFVLVVGPGENSPAQTAAAGVDLLLPDALSSATIVTRVMQLVRRQIESTTPVPAAQAGLLAPAPTAPPIERSPASVAAPVITPPPLTPPPTSAAPPSAPTRIVSPPVVSPPAIEPTAQPAGVPAPSAAAPIVPGLDTVGPNGGARTFQGALGVLEIEELTQAIAVGGKTGRLVLVLQSGGGLIVFERGRVTHAEFGGQAGEPAFGALVAACHREHGGKFCFIPLHPTELRSQPKTIVRGVHELLLDVARTLDEERRA